MYKGLLKQYASYLPVNENTPDVSLMEGIHRLSRY